MIYINIYLNNGTKIIYSVYELICNSISTRIINLVNFFIIISDYIIQFNHVFSNPKDFRLHKFCSSYYLEATSIIMKLHFYFINKVTVNM